MSSWGAGPGPDREEKDIISFCSFVITGLNGCRASWLFAELLREIGNPIKSIVGIFALGKRGVGASSEWRALQTCTRSYRPRRAYVSLCGLLPPEAPSSRPFMNPAFPPLATIATAVKSFGSRGLRL